MIQLPAVAVYISGHVIFLSIAVIDEPVIILMFMPKFSDSAKDVIPLLDSKVNMNCETVKCKEKRLTMHHNLQG